MHLSGPSSVLALLLLFLSRLTASSSLSPFYAPYDDTLDPLARPDLLPTPLALLLRRQACPSAYSACTILNVAGACCQSGTVCSLDGAGNVACCPSNAICSGTITKTSAPSSSSSASLVPTTTTSTSLPSSGPTQSTGPGGIFLNPSSTLPNTNPTATAQATGAAGAAGATTIQNAYNFPFLALPTSFPNPSACSSGYSSCTSQYSLCLASLGGGANPVTVTGGGASIGIPGATGTLGTAASSVCSSLSSEACRGLQPGVCTAFTGSATASGGLAGSGASLGPRAGGWSVLGVWIVGGVLGVGVVGQALL
ncbi:MAG: hypothetical protein M1824_000877 [Vezdaea acicularis]|nr:MAG: hypothetical protein M1824_000877 [Vezdaea acicularis]